MGSLHPLSTVYSSQSTGTIYRVTSREVSLHTSPRLTRSSCCFVYHCHTTTYLTINRSSETVHLPSQILNKFRAFWRIETCEILFTNADGLQQAGGRF